MVLHTWLRLAFATAWAVVGVGLLLRHTIFPPEMFGQFDPGFLTAGGLLALVLAAYNLLRWRAVARRPRRTGPVNPLARRTEPVRPREYNPDLDFTTRPPAGPPGPGSPPPATTPD